MVKGIKRYSPYGKGRTSRRVKDIRSNRTKRALRRLSKFEQNQIAFSKRLFSDLQPFSERMSQFLGIEHPPTYESLKVIPAKKIIKSFALHKFFLDIS